ncbi:MAG: hypothetical protein PF637_03980 [Spirochaetes bacterium]|jgi:hypothetical protein|nr:hypothetical protein [Spirochaetota bacterium]
MKVFVCSDTKKTEEIFASVIKSKNFEVLFCSSSEYRKILKDDSIEDGSLFYLDISKFEDTSLSKEVNFLLKQENLFVGIIDPKGKIGDVAALFHKGLADYIGKTLCGGKAIDSKRINGLEEFKRKSMSEEELATVCSEITDFTLVKKDWSNVVVGKEFTFLFMHIYFDNYYEIEKTYGRAHVAKMIQKIRDYLTCAVAPSGGKVWMWMEASGLILFPFDGLSCNIIDLGFKLILNRHIINLENGFRNPLSYRLSAHIGNTTYQEAGETGTIVSESINTIFHLGNKFTTPGSFFMTPEVARFIPERVNDLFVQIGEYEGRMITRMKLPLNI